MSFKTHSLCNVRVIAEAKIGSAYFQFLSRKFEYCEGPACGGVELRSLTANALIGQMQEVRRNTMTEKLKQYVQVGLTTVVAVFSVSVTAMAQEFEFEAEQFEYRVTEEGEDLFVWDATASIGTEDIKVQYKTGGEYTFSGEILEDFTNELTLRTPISEFWDVGAGVRLDNPQAVDRWYGMIGISSSEDFPVELSSDFYVSENGDASLGLEAAYKWEITEKLALRPKAELDVAFSSDPEVGVGTGVSSAELGLRLSYQLLDQIAPYVGVVYERSFGQTEDMAKEEGEVTRSWQAVIGARITF